MSGRLRTTSLTKGPLCWRRGEEREQMAQLNNRQAAMGGVLGEESEETRGCVTQQPNWRTKENEREEEGTGEKDMR